MARFLGALALYWGKASVLELLWKTSNHAYFGVGYFMALRLDSSRILKVPHLAAI